MVTLSINSYMIGRLLKNIKRNLFELYTKMSYSYYVSKNTGDFINLITEQPNRAIESFRQLILFGSTFNKYNCPYNTCLSNVIQFWNSCYNIWYYSFDFICKNEFIFTKTFKNCAKKLRSE